MSHLRAPAARADRREGGRHGRPVAHPVPSLPEAHIRPQLLRLAVLPPVAVALSACAAVLFTVRSTGARTSLTLWAVLAGAVCVTLVGIGIAVIAADRAARAVHERVGALRRSSARREADLRALVEALRRGEVPPPRKPRGGPPEDADDFELLAADLARAHDGAVTAVVQAAQLSSQAGSEQKLEVFVNLARRLQSLVHREIAILDELENEIEDPDLLKGLFHVDHLATRIRRHAENLAVLGGAVSRRQWSNPVSMTEVLRSAIAEVEQYSRVRLVPPIDGTLRGHAVADVIHLLAELVENATVFSAPQTQVLLRANLVTSGLAVEVEDRGLGMPVAEQNKMNALLTDPDQVNVARLLADGRIGLFVVSQLARRHGITVRLQTNIYGGVQAVLVVPQALLGNQPDAARPAPPPQHHQPAPDAGTAPAPTGTGPSPLPLRGTHEERPNPVEAVPGIRPEDRPAVEEPTGAPPTGTVRGTMGKPQLPRRRAHQHIAPQLRGGPAPRPDAEHLVGHDPGLMAAFQRGIGLAEAQQQAQSTHSASAHSASAHSGSVHSASVHQEPSHQEPSHIEHPHMERPHTPPGSPPDARHTDVTPMPTHLPMAVPHMDVRHMDGRHTGGRYMNGTRAGVPPHAGGRHMEAPHADAPPHIEAAHMTPDHPARHDGSGPAG
ncbi:ATP-binding protein [Streptomyces sp. TRM70350]|uniref:ATP-binding protein n=1 Tax=Streptomyces sp. TRM70350 TaxID=2856165 RepID=UPI001C4864D0|nr:ATP-binding protein [Streptomyces sp. TRM70350]MBV7694390.1 ATP-binding protein [Streptomyces sp. TRM70350]